MSGEVNVLSRTQIVRVDPVTKSVSVINAGPQGPGSGGGGGGGGGPVFAEDVIVEDPHGYFSAGDAEGVLAELYEGIQAVDTGGGGGGAASGPGPNWVASSTAPAALKAAVLAAGGVVCDGTADEADVVTKLAAYNDVVLTEGDYAWAASVTVGKGKSLHSLGGPRTARLMGAAALTTGQFILVNSENAFVAGLYIKKNAANAVVDGIVLNIPSGTGFDSGGESKTVIRDCIADGVHIGYSAAGNSAQDTKLYNLTAKACTQYGFWIDSPDGNMLHCTAGSIVGPGDGTGHGFVFTSNSASWHVGLCKAWFCKGDGWYIRGVRHYMVGIEGQDCSYAGIRMNAFFSTIIDPIADSNSYTNGNTFAQNGLHAGIEVGLTQAGAKQGGDSCTLIGGHSWDKNEGSRGYAQKYGIWIKATINGLTILGLYTGDPADTHKNITDGAFFANVNDITRATNNILFMNHNVRVSSTPSTPVEFMATNTVGTAFPNATLAGVATFDQALLPTIRYAFDAFFEYLADAADGFQYQPTLVGAAGSWEINYQVSGMVDDIVCSTTVSTSKFSATAHGLQDGTPVIVNGFTLTTGIPTGTVLYVVGSTVTAFQLARTINGAPLTMGGTADAAVTVSPIALSDGSMSRVTSGGVGGSRTKFRGAGDGSDSSINRRVLRVSGVIYTGSAACSLSHRFAKAVASSAHDATLVSPSWTRVRTLS